MKIFTSIALTLFLSGSVEAIKTKDDGRLREVLRAIADSGSRGGDTHYHVNCGGHSNGGGSHEKTARETGKHTVKEVKKALKKYEARRAKKEKQHEALEKVEKAAEEVKHEKEKKHAKHEANKVAKAIKKAEKK